MSSAFIALYYGGRAPDAPPTEDAIELYRLALRVIALAGLYPQEDVGYVISRLRQEQARHDRSESDWKAFEHMCDALMTAAL